jgi:uncharacterized membrane protein (DUF485 family)
MHHGPAVELGKDNSIQHKTRLGLKLFFVYLIIYAGFVIIGTLYPHLMGITVVAGLNLAFVYGMGLIVLAIVMGLVYNFFSTGFEDKYNKEEEV